MASTSSSRTAAGAQSRPFRERLTSILRSRRLRTAALLVAGYNGYRAFKTHTTLNKTFSAARHRPGQTVLDLDLDAVQLVTHESLAAFSSAEELRLHRLIATLEDAKHDPRVAGLVVRGISGLRGVGLAEIAELRAVIRDFATGWGGKPTVLHVPEGLGGSGNGTIPLYFASAFDSVHVQPTSSVVIPGLSLSTLFFRRALDNIGVKAKKVARKEFKTAANSFTEDRFTDPHRESTEALLNAIMNDVITGIAEGRGIAEDNVRDAIDTALMNAQEAQKHGIIDEPLYRDQLPGIMRDRLRMSEEQCEKIRVEAVEEWREAMRELKTIWTVEGGAADMWGDGDILQDAAQFETALPVALSFGDQRVELIKKTTDAEIRALKAHLRWLDTRPWEAPLGTGEEKNNLYRTDANIAAILEVERRLCESAIKTLEECPQLVESYRQAAEDDSVLKLDQDNALSLIRWCRGMWRAKCLAARMVGTLLDYDEELHTVLRSAEDDDAKTQLKSLASSPKLFLAGYTEELSRIAQRVQEATSEKNLRDDASEDDAGKKVEKKSSPEAEKARRKALRYVKFADYIDTVNGEKRAVVDRSGAGSMVRISSKDPYGKLPGTIDFQERNALLRLQLAGHRFAPWRVSVPKGDVIAIITIDGPITDDRADITRSAIRRADKDPNIKAIVLRIDSPGGSVTASDLISRAVEVAKKPVVASMSNVCASGGYFISAPCDKVFASNMTITGSIGVILSAFNTAGLFEKLGITADSCESGKFSKYFGAQGSITEWSEEFASRIDTMIDNLYADFVNVVARGRKMQVEEAEKVAKGRVWAGSNALALGLVDEIGGLREAVEAAAELAYLAPDAQPRAYDYPTVAMQVQDAARRRGLIPSNLDEEGDESLPQRRRGWFQSQPKKGEDEGSEADGTKDAELIPAATTLSHLAYEYRNLQHFAADSMLSWIHNFLLSSSVSSPTSDFIEALLGRMVSALGKDRATSVIVEELERTRATAGRPATIAPHYRVDN